MNTNRRLLQVYIHPDSGPILPMTLDLDAVEVAMNKVPEAHVSDELAVHELAKQIRAKFKEIIPDDQKGKRQLAMIMRRWVNIQGFNGIALLLTGSIKGKNPDEREAGQLSQELTRLTDALEKERRAKETLQLRLHDLERESRRFKALYQQANAELMEQRKQTKQALDEASQERRAAAGVQGRVDQAAQEVGRYKLRLEELQREIQARPTQAHYEKELAELRNKERRLRASEQQLKEALDTRDQEILALHGLVSELTEGSLGEATAKASVNDFDDL